MVKKVIGSNSNKWFSEITEDFLKGSFISEPQDSTLKGQISILTAPKTNIYYWTYLILYSVRLITTIWTNSKQTNISRVEEIILSVSGTK